jgi:hypothetical protein
MQRSPPSHFVTQQGQQCVIHGSPLSRTAVLPRTRQGSAISMALERQFFAAWLAPLSLEESS